MIPEGWKKQTLGASVRVHGGYAFKSSEFVYREYGSVPVVRMSNIKAGKLDLSEAVHIADVAEFQDYLLSEGDFVFGMSGSIENCAFVRKGDLPALLNQRVGKLVCKNGYPPFFGFLYQSEIVLGALKRLAEGNAQKNISPGMIEALEVLIPPEPEQKQIVKCLSALCEVIEESNQTLAQTRRLKQALLHQLLTKGIDENGKPHTRFKKTEIGEIPEEWEVCKIGDGCTIANNLRKPIEASVRQGMQGPYPYYGPTGQIDSINEFRFQGEFALIGEDGDHFLKWKTKPQTQLVSGSFNVNNHAHAIGRSERCLPSWFFYYFCHRNITGILKRQGVGRYKLSKGILVDIPIALPRLSEQERIHVRMQELSKAEECQRDQALKLMTLNRAVSSDLLSGRVRVKDLKL